MTARATTHTQAARQFRAARVAGQAGTARPAVGRPGAVRLTRRGRRVVAGFAILVVLAAVAAIWISAAGSVQAASGTPARSSAYQGMTQVVVRPGQTLWSLAAAAEPSGNPYAVMQQIISVNALSSPEIHTGEMLWVPHPLTRPRTP